MVAMPTMLPERVAAEAIANPLSRQEIRSWMEEKGFPEAIANAFREEMNAQGWSETSGNYRIYAEDFLDWDYIVEEVLL